MKIRELIVKLTATFFYVGFLPLIPGTFGSLAGIGLFYLVKDNPFIYGVLVLVLIAAGFWSGTQAEAYFKKKDPKYVVIDEVCGMLISLAFLPRYDFKIVVAAFFLFRFFDTLKIYPACRLQGIKGSMGIMIDDLVAALYTNIILQVALRFAWCKTS
ncbi:MAG: phosphatidylglycerophosphatase A [Candidatus Omnitrophica bacterium]|jgi:phosphatidylglycerophosphatase A|nr:phosphatidylglycerophosphatase A [Candidatus Omnitrophota bacterium]